MVALDPSSISRDAALVVDDVVTLEGHAPKFAAADGQSGSCGRRRLDADFAVFPRFGLFNLGTAVVVVRWARCGRCGDSATAAQTSNVARMVSLQHPLHVIKRGFF